MLYRNIQFKTSDPYNFNISVNGSSLEVHVRYNAHLDRYYLDIDRYERGTFKNIMSGVMLYTGFNLFMQSPQFDLGELYVIPLKSELYHKDPSPDNIRDYMLFWKSRD